MMDMCITISVALMWRALIDFTDSSPGVYSLPNSRTPYRVMLDTTMSMILSRYSTFRILPPSALRTLRSLWMAETKSNTG